MIYGNYSLQRDDNDGNPSANQPPTWGGAVATPAPLSAQTPQNQGGATLAIPQHVRQLQEDLRELGFFMIQVVDGDFGRYTEWAVREFQIYAGMSHVAGLNRNELTTLTNDPNAGETAPEVTARGQVPNQSPPVSFYVATLEQRANTARYTGPISGVVNQQTRDAIEHWLANNYRCPVVIEAWNIAQNNRTTLYPNGSNIWRIDQMATTDPRLYFRDFSVYYSYPSTRGQSEYHVLGTYMSYGAFSGPLSKVPKHTWSEAEILPERLIGGSATIASLASNPNSSRTSTYRVVRAVSEVECMAFFDSVNAYDPALVSVGPCHWTMGIFPAGGYDDGELPGFLAYYLSLDEQSYRKAFGYFGLYPHEEWAGVNMPPHWHSQHRKYIGWLRYHNENTLASQSPPLISTMDLVKRDPAEADYLKTWHWFFRFVMAGRTIQGYQKAMWGMARIRLRDLRAHQTTIVSGATTITESLGNILTSEKANAIILRWHVFKPANVVGNTLNNALAAAINNNPQLNWSGSAATWSDAHESALIAEVLSVATSVNQTHSHVANWPNYPWRSARGYFLNNQLGPLREARNSFQFDTIGI